MPWASFNRFELELPQECVDECSGSGDAAPAVQWWLDNDPRVSWNVLCIPKDLLVLELLEYGAWDEDGLSDWRENQERIVWIAAGNIHEEQLQETNNDDNSRPSPRVGCRQIPLQERR